MVSKVAASTKTVCIWLYVSKLSKMCQLQMQPCPFMRALFNIFKQAQIIFVNEGLILFMEVINILLYEHGLCVLFVLSDILM